MPGERHFGAPMKRLEDEALLRGAGRFVDDIDLPGAWHAAFVRSPHAHARISAIDTKAARALPGVHAVLTYHDMPQCLRENRIPLRVPNAAIREPRMPWPLVRDEVAQAGEGVAVVLADSRYIAEDAAALVDVAYELLPPVSDCRAAVAPGAPLAHIDTKDNICARFVQSYGNVDAAFERAAHRASVSLWQHRGSGHAIENRACLGQYDVATDKLTLWVAGQTPHGHRRVNELLFGLDSSQIRIIMPDVGGGFGTKANYFVEQAVIAACTLRFKRPIKWIEDRRENFLTATQERDQYWDMELALDRDGKILGVRGTLLA